MLSGQPISFNMRSTEFKTLVQSGKIEFKNGSTIICLLQFRKKIDNNGIERIVAYDVLRIDNYFENDSIVETKEGKLYKKKVSAEKTQLNFFDSDM
jgi:hypothetical protein